MLIKLAPTYRYLVVFKKLDDSVNCTRSEAVRINIRHRRSIG
ncbi:hypothetical protein SJ05684_b55430 (plasmid) [Sinorhizobium sojae CCBAU 05684]|uniref:Uncharacterized protein n=1 Tax=Sinorhizobium sojae CCBAU 05684 TaxID=716928 RepID=A0A249PLD1_9HYPH|nr:hypothetical protein SJ05684_b55430 [Sinorhizobium sojae CCBAU 05684]